MDLLGEIFSDCVTLCGKPMNTESPDFLLLALASLAREDATLYSDVECSIVVRNKSPLKRNYFRNLLRVFGFVMSCIGEPEGFHLEQGKFAISFQKLIFLKEAWTTEYFLQRRKL